MPACVRSKSARIAAKAPASRPSMRWCLKTMRTGSPGAGGGGSDDRAQPATRTISARRRARRTWGRCECSAGAARLQLDMFVLQRYYLSSQGEQSMTATLTVPTPNSPAAVAAEPIERAIQFLVCPQRDFIGWLDPGTKPPNRLHVGAAGAEKLRGSPGTTDRFVETVRRFYDDARPGTDRLRVVFDEDWHPRRCDEFAVYGEHCVKGTKGAELVGGLEAFRWHPRTFVLRANSVNVAASP